MRIILPKPDFNSTAARREFYCVREKIPDDLLQAVRVAHESHTQIIELRLNLNLFGVGCEPHGVNRREQNGRKINAADVQAKLA